MQKESKQGFEPRTLLLQGNSTTNCGTVQAFIAYSLQ